MVDIIIDFETLGSNVHKCPALDMSYIAFDWDRFLTEPYTFDELVNSEDIGGTIKFDVEDQIKNYSCQLTKHDIKWWDEIRITNPKAYDRAVKPSKNDVSVSDFCEIFINFLAFKKNIDRFWSRGNTFDPIILWRLFSDCGELNKLDIYLKHWKARDTRTYMESLLGFDLKSTNFCPIDDETLWKKYFQHHNSRHDCAADILRMQKIYRTYKGDN